MMMKKTLPDGTEAVVRIACSCGYTPCRGGQHVGAGLTVVDLFRDGQGLRLISGIRSSHRTSLALDNCVHWTEVPMAVEAASWRPLPNPSSEDPT